jgi:hypothetical protein
MGVAELTIRELDFQAAAAFDGAPQLELSGNADGRIEAALFALVNAFHEDACSASARHVVVDIRRLEFMNASCFNVFVSWLALVNELAPERRYELRFTTNPKMPWQRRSLRTLSCFATDLVVLG